jgi:hypothetical protein
MVAGKWAAINLMQGVGLALFIIQLDHVLTTLGSPQSVVVRLSDARPRCTLEPGVTTTRLRGYFLPSVLR